MYVIDVAPLTREARRSVLSYFSKTPYERGTILNIPLRAKTAEGVVVGSEPVSLAKAALRGAAFFLRKLPAQKQARILPEAVRATTAELAEYCATEQGTVLLALLPKEVRSGRVPIPEVQEYRLPVRSGISERGLSERSEFPQRGNAGADGKGFKRAYEILEAPREARLREYRRIIRRAFAEGTSVTIAVPSVADGEYLAEQIGPEALGQTLILHTGIGAPALRETYTRIAAERGPLLIIATPRHALLASLHTRALIIERSRSSAYRSRTKPYLDLRDALRLCAEKLGARCISADTLVRSEDIARTNAPPARAGGAFPGAIETIPLKEATADRKEFVLFSAPLLDALKQTRSRGGRAFLFCARRGLSPLVACRDCGAILRCPRSGSPLALHRRVRNGQEVRLLVSPVSGYRRRADDTCPSCGSWRLREQGVGIQQVYDEIIRYFGRDNIFLLDRENAPTHTKAAVLRDQFYGRDGAFLLGTPLALTYLTEPMDTSAVISMDSLLATPTWRAEEEALGVLLTLREHTTETVFVQMRGEDEHIIRHAEQKTATVFHEEELALRKQLRYPPFFVFIHLAWKKSAGNPLPVDFAERIAPHRITLYSPPTAEQICYGLIRVPAEQWPQDALVDALRALPPSVRVSINPDRIV